MSLINYISTCETEWTQLIYKVWGHVSQQQHTVSSNSTPDELFVDYASVFYDYRTINSIMSKK